MADLARVLLIASGKHDTVGDSYRRALDGHYDVRIEDPEPPGFPRWASKGLSVLANAAAAEPHAFVLPRLVRAARSLVPDVVLVTHVQSIPPHTLEQIRRVNPHMRIVGVFSDHISNFDRGYFFSASYDGLFFKDRYIVDKLRTKLGWRHVWYLPQACDPALHRPVDAEPGDEERYGCDIALAGNLHYFRAEALRPVLARRWAVKIWGTDPGRWFQHPMRRVFQGRPVTGLEKSRAMRAAKIVLNQNHYSEIAGTNKRTFEVAAMGAFQLTDTPALDDVFDAASEVAKFDSSDEMLDQLAHYLRHPEERAAMAGRARLRALREHTYAHRWAAKMKALGLSLPRSFPVQPETLAVLGQ